MPCIVMVSKSPFEGESHCSNQCGATKLLNKFIKYGRQNKVWL